MSNQVVITVSHVDNEPVRVLRQSNTRRLGEGRAVHVPILVACKVYKIIVTILKLVSASNGCAFTSDTSAGDATHVEIIQFYRYYMV